MLTREEESFWRENVVAVIILQRVLVTVREVFAFCSWEMAQLPSISITVLTFLVKKSTIKNSGVSIF